MEFLTYFDRKYFNCIHVISLPEEKSSIAQGKFSL